jgi:UDP-3-O-acyl-N-acetylglucosamine deacetylase
MADLLRRTLAGAAEVSGAGLFTGAPARVRILPGAEGIRFRCGQTEIPARVENAFSPPELPGRNTCLRSGAAAVLTVEHVLSALAGLGITDAVIEAEGPEIPIGDGSALPFTEAIGRAGVRDLGSACAALVISRRCEARSGDAEIVATPLPGGGSEYCYVLDYGPGSPIHPQSAEIALGPGGEAGYAAQIGPARTFCLEAEARAMAAAGLFRHLSMRDMLVFGDHGPIDNALRFENEPARHKLLDLIGDLSLAGRPIRGRIVARKSGHALNREMAARLIAEFG